MPGSPLFNIFGGVNGSGPSFLPPGIGNALAMFQQFRQAFKGDPKQQVQDLLNSGKITQEQYNRAVRMTNELSKYIH